MVIFSCDKINYYPGESFKTSEIVKKPQWYNVSDLPINYKRSKGILDGYDS